MRPDLRLALPAVVAWLGALAALGLPWWAWLTAAVLAFGGSARGCAGLACALVAVFVVTACATELRASAHRHSLIADAARKHAFVSLELTLTSDPATYDGRFGDFVVARGRASELVWRGARHPISAPVLVLSSADWSHAALGAKVRVSGRMDAADSSDLAGSITVSREPEIVAKPGPVLRAAARLRGEIRAAVIPASAEARALIPGLVVGDDQGLSEETVDDFKLAGLTHLTAVSGTNLTLVVGFLLLIARTVGVRGRGLVVLGLLGVVGFVVLARPEPSVVRAAAMGAIALLGWGADGRSRGIRTLSGGVLVLLSLDPWLAVSIGFALSVCATAGILLLGPPFRDALARWLPSWIAEAFAIPLAAQLACTPLVAVVSGQVSLVAVVANLLVAPAVAPATVLGLVGGLVHLAWPWAGEMCGRVAGLCADWIVLVAHRSAALPNAALPWSTGVAGIALLILLCIAIAWWGPAFVASRGRTLCIVTLLVVGLVRPMPTLGWPPAGWVMVACSVGQGDGLVLRAGPHSGVVVDAGPDPRLMDQCLRRIGIREVPVVVLTHFHADHVDGLSGVLRGRQVGEVDVTSLREPAANARAVDDLVGDRERVPALGEVRTVGDVSWQVLGPVRTPNADGDESEQGSGPNNASLVLLVQIHGIRILMSGDIEPEAQRSLLRSVHELHADVLKVPHHGSRNQEPDFITGLGARLAVIAVGKDNDYGHPSATTVDLLRHAGMTVARTDLDGDAAVVVDDAGRLRVATRG